MIWLLQELLAITKLETKIRCGYNTATLSVELTTDMTPVRPVRRQAITWINANLLSIGPLGTNFSEIEL